MRRWLLLIPLAVAVMAPSLLLGPSHTHSQLYNFIWTRQFADAMAAGELYPRWLPASFEGLGSPTFYFYPPLTFWVSGGLDALGLSSLQAINVAVLMLLIASGLTMYLWLSYRGTRPLLGAALYMLAPYHLNDWYVRGALAEFAAFVWLPLIALGIEALPKRWAPPLLAVSFAGLIITHLPVALLTTVFLIAPLALHRAWKDRSALAPGILAGVLGLALAAFYLLPALTLREHVSSQLLWGVHYQPSRWFVWNAPPDWFTFGLLPITIGMAMLSLGARSVWTAIAIVGAAVSVGLTPFVWDLPLLAQAQFPWRLLCVVEFAAITSLMGKPPRPLLTCVAAAFLLVALIVGIKGAVIAMHIRTDYRELSALMPDPPEYLPRGFDVSEIADQQRRLDLTPYRKLPSAAGDIVVEKSGPVTVRRSAFPIWRVQKDGVYVPTRGPLITFDATPGTYRVVRVTLWQEWAGALISAAALLLLALAWRLRVPADRAGARRRPQTPATPS
jgi:uncharacterized membrane protein